MNTMRVLQSAAAAACLLCTGTAGAEPHGAEAGRFFRADGAPVVLRRGKRRDGRPGRRASPSASADGYAEFGGFRIGASASAPRRAGTASTAPTCARRSASAA